MNNTFTHGTRELRENLQPATHYMEVWKGEDCPPIITLWPRPIEKLPESLYWTKQDGDTTIAVFKIREKKTLKAGDRLRCIKYVPNYASVGEVVLVQQARPFELARTTEARLCIEDDESRFFWWVESIRDNWKRLFEHFELITE